MLLFRLLMVPEMPLKNKRSAPGRGEQPTCKSASSGQVCPRPDSSEPSSDEAEVELSLLAIMSSTMVVPSQLKNMNQFLLEQKASTNKRLDDLVNRLESDV